MRPPSLGADRFPTKPPPPTDGKLMLAGRLGTHAAWFKPGANALVWVLALERVLAAAGVPDEVESTARGIELSGTGTTALAHMLDWEIRVGDPLPEGTVEVKLHGLRDIETLPRTIALSKRTLLSPGDAVWAASEGYWRRVIQTVGELRCWDRVYVLCAAANGWLFWQEGFREPDKVLTRGNTGIA